MQFLACLLFQDEKTFMKGRIVCACVCARALCCMHVYAHVYVAVLEHMHMFIGSKSISSISLNNSSPCFLRTWSLILAIQLDWLSSQLLGSWDLPFSLYLLPQSKGYRHDLMPLFLCMCVYGHAGDLNLDPHAYVTNT